MCGGACVGGSYSAQSVVLYGVGDCRGGRRLLRRGGEYGSAKRARSRVAVQHTQQELQIFGEAGSVPDVVPWLGSWGEGFVGSGSQGHTQGYNYGFGLRVRTGYRLEVSVKGTGDIRVTQGSHRVRV